MAAVLITLFVGLLIALAVVIGLLLGKKEQQPRLPVDAIVQIGRAGNRARTGISRRQVEAAAIHQRHVSALRQRYADASKQVGEDLALRHVWLACGALNDAALADQLERELTTALLLHLPGPADMHAMVEADRAHQQGTEHGVRSELEPIAKMLGAGGRAAPPLPAALPAPAWPMAAGQLAGLAEDIVARARLYVEDVAREVLHKLEGDRSELADVAVSMMLPELGTEVPSWKRQQHGEAVQQALSDEKLLTRLRADVARAVLDQGRRAAEAVGGAAEGETREATENLRGVVQRWEKAAIAAAE